MKRLLCAICAVLLVAGCAPAQSDSSPDSGAPSADASKADFLPTAYARPDDKGVYSLSVDADGDGSEELFALAPADELDTGAFLSVSADGVILDSVCTDGLYPVEFAAADLIADDGCVELIASCDYASDDYVTSVFRFEDGALVFCGKADGRAESALDGIVTLKLYGHPLGTWWLYGNYRLDADKDGLVPCGGFSIRPEDCGWGQNDTVSSFPSVAVSIEARTEDGLVTLEEGTIFMPVECDLSSYVVLLTADGLRCRVDVRYVEDEYGAEQTMVVLPDGSLRNADEVFRGLFYWG